MGRIRRHLTFANVMVVILCFIVLGGGAYAAFKLPKNSVGTKQLRKGAVTLNKIRPAARTKLQGEVGPRGPQGKTGKAGAKGATGARGPAGTDATVGGNAPGGSTLRGSFGVGGEVAGNGAAEDLSSRGSIDFGGYLIPFRPIAQIVAPPSFGYPVPPACPGNAQAPSAAPGFLCVYVVEAFPEKKGTLVLRDSSQATFNGTVFNMATGSALPFGDGRVGRGGAVVVGEGEGKELSFYGTWAVTLP